MTRAAPCANGRSPEHLGAAADRTARQMWRGTWDHAAPISNQTSTRPYAPVELAPSVRPGAMDAYALPSLRMGRRVWPRGAQQETLQ